MARTSTYLNFSRHTEEAFNFYKSIFGGEFGGDGLVRFKDMPAMEGLPPLHADDANLVIHVELAITGGHVLMGTDAPESMGFSVKGGNNMHLNLEPDSRKEARRLFNSLAIEGKISQPLDEMFWGAYFGSLTDKFGINWMVNCTATE